MAAAPAWDDKKFELTIGRLLRAGVLLAAAWVVFGGVHYLVQSSGTKPDFKAFRGEPADLRYASAIIRDAIQFHARGIIQLGLLLLIATPMARVAFSVIGFAMERDWMYVGITLVVLALLVYSLGSS
jgi:uncharacterized membrane protein